MHVLFVEDDEVVAQSVEMALRANGHKCETTDLGATALALSKRNDYDIVVLDVGLPDMDGYHVVRRMKMEGVETPLLMQSGLDGAEPPTDAQGLGCKDFIPKPFSIAELLDRMEEVLGISQPADPEPVTVQPEARSSVKSAATIWNQSADSAAPTAPAAPAAPVERPSAVAAARQALRDQPEPPTRLQVAQEALSETSAKALSKAGSGAKVLSSKAESSVKALSEKAEVGAKSLSSTAGSGAKVFSKVVTKARGAVGPKDGEQIDPRREPELNTPPMAETEAPQEPTAGEKPDGKKSGKSLSKFVAKARSAVEANPLSGTMDKARSVFRSEPDALAQATAEYQAVEAKEASGESADPKDGQEVAPKAKSRAKPLSMLVAKAQAALGANPSKDQTDVPDPPEDASGGQFEPTLTLEAAAAHTEPQDPNPSGDASDGHAEPTLTLDADSADTEHQIAIPLEDTSDSRAEPTLTLDEDSANCEPEAPGPSITGFESRVEEPAQPDTVPQSEPEPDSSVEPSAAEALETVPEVEPLELAEPEPASETEIEAETPAEDDVQAEFGIEEPLPCAPEMDVSAELDPEPMPGADSDSSVEPSAAEALETAPEAEPLELAEPEPAAETEAKTLAEDDVQAELGAEELTPSEPEPDVSAAPESGTDADAGDGEPVAEEPQDTAASDAGTGESEPVASAPFDWTASLQAAWQSEPAPETASDVPEVAAETPCDPAPVQDADEAFDWMASLRGGAESESAQLEEDGPQAAEQDTPEAALEVEAASETEPHAPCEPEPDAPCEPALTSETEFEVSCDPEPVPEAEPADESNMLDTGAPVAEFDAPSEATDELDFREEHDAGSRTDDPVTAEVDEEPEAQPEDNTAAGGGFISSDVVEKDGAERRRHERKTVIEAAVIADGTNNIPCAILDLSESGAMLLVSKADLVIPDTFILRPLDGEEHNSVLRWREADRIGIEFT